MPPCAPFDGRARPGRVGRLSRFRSETRSEEHPPARHDRPRPARRAAQGLAITLRDRAAGRARHHHQTAASSSSTGPFIVQADGFVDLGLFGDVYVYGLTLPEAEERIAVQLNDAARQQKPESTEKYRVSVRLTNGQSKYYYVLGTVANPGRMKASSNDTVLDAILQAGLKSNSLPEKAYLVRPHALGGEDQVYKIDWLGIKDRGDTLTNYQLFPGDRVVVPGTRPPGLIKSLLGN